MFVPIEDHNGLEQWINTEHIDALVHEKSGNWHHVHLKLASGVAVQVYHGQNAVECEVKKLSVLNTIAEEVIEDADTLDAEPF